MLKFSIEDIKKIPGAVLLHQEMFRDSVSVVTDSRENLSGGIFVALVGDKFNGHNFLEDAAQKGASALVIESKRLGEFRNLACTIIAVPDTKVAYGDLAALWRDKLTAKIISITGSNGKTGTKEMLACLLSEKYRVSKTDLNNNNDIGVPLSILQATEETEFLILEHGTNHFGEIAYTALVARPDISLITNIGASHLEYLVDAPGVFREKAALYDATKELIFVNLDDPFLKSYTGKGTRRFTYGFNQEADFSGRILGYDDLGRASVSISSAEGNLEVGLNLPGMNSAKNFLAACALAFKCGMNSEEISLAAKKILPVKGRLRFNELNNYVLIDDTYNSNPESVKAALEVVGNIKKYRRKYLLLGDMFELGEKTREMHSELASQIENVTAVFTIGEMMECLHQALLQKGIPSTHFVDREALSEFLLEKDFEDSVLLIKGSRGMRMEEFVNLLLTRE